MNCQVKVTQGVLQGKECKTFYGKTYYSFEGIPYAKPPVGKLRFKAPEEPESWQGIRDATKPGNKCYQINPYGNTGFEGSEDCLYLNVYTPSLPQEKIEKLPVFFFVHGGRLIFGYGNYYQPDYLLKHDVILVTINYRLNILGFLCLDIPEVPGNAGLKDTIMALKWVNKNISNFNGDPNNVIAMGESAGAGAIGSYLTSKMADGLYHKMICQSGVPVSDLYMIERENPIDKAKLIASYLGNKELSDQRSLYEFLVDVPIEDLMQAFCSAELSRPMSEINAFFLPVVEKEFDGVERFFSSFPRNDIPTNKHRKVPMIIGLASHEAAAFVMQDDEGNILFEDNFYYFIPKYLNVYEGDAKVDEIVKKLRKFYLNNEEVNKNNKEKYIDMISDRYFDFDIHYMVECIAKFSEGAYFYIFDYNGNLNTRTIKNLGMKGAAHGDMIQYQFYRKRKHDKGSKEDIKITEMLSEAWCNFAKTGQPSWSGQQTKWRPYSKKGKQTLVISDKTQLVRNPYLHRIKFWQGILGESSKL